MNPRRSVTVCGIRGSRRQASRCRRSAKLSKLLYVVVWRRRPKAAGCGIRSRAMLAQSEVASMYRPASAVLPFREMVQHRVSAGRNRQKAAGGVRLLPPTRASRRAAWQAAAPAASARQPAQQQPAVQRRRCAQRRSRFQPSLKGSSAACRARPGEGRTERPCSAQHLHANRSWHAPVPRRETPESKSEE